MATSALFTATIAEMTATAVRAAALRIQDFPDCFRVRGETAAERRD